MVWSLTVNLGAVGALGSNPVMMVVGWQDRKRETKGGWEAFEEIEVVIICVTLIRLFLISQDSVN